MAADIAPELYERIKKIFDEKYSRATLLGNPIGDTLKKLESKNATFRDADLYAVEVGNLLVESMMQVLDLDELPNQKMYYNIAQKTIGQSLEDAYGIVSNTTCMIVEEMNDKAGINLKAVQGKANSYKQNQILNSACNATNNEQLHSAIDKSVLNYVQAAADDTKKANAEFQRKAGMEVKVSRTYDQIGLRRKTKYAEKCSWCLKRCGKDVTYKKALSMGMFERHEGCGCIIEYVSRKGEKTVSDSRYGGFDKIEDPKEHEEKINNKDVSHNKTKRINNGALNDKNDKDWEKRDKHAKKYYTNMRNADEEIVVKKMSVNSGIDIETTRTAYEHVFKNKHILDEKLKYFDDDYDMAESWRRLRTNDNIQEHDKILLLHEALEADIMKKNPDMSYEKAHKLTEEKYNYSKALRDWKRKNA